MSLSKGGFHHVQDSFNLRGLNLIPYHLSILTSVVVSLALSHLICSTDCFVSGFFEYELKTILP